MRVLTFSSLLFGVLLLAGCPDDGDDDSSTGDDDATGDDDTSGDDDITDNCTSEALPWLLLWSHEFPSDGVPRAGEFSAWSHDDVRFLSEQDTFEFEVHGDEALFGALPDLSTAGEVELVQVGSYDDTGGGTHGAVVVHSTDDPSTVLMMTAQHWEGQGDFSGWNVVSNSMDTTVCEAFPIEDECCLTVYNRPVAFEFGDESFTLFQGQERQVGELTVRVSEAWAHGGDQTCPDYFCPRLRYMAYRSALP